MSLPDNLKKFIVRCYNDIPQEKHPIMETQLKEIVTNAIKNGKQFEVDWDRMVLPIHTAHLLDDQKVVAPKRKLGEPLAQPLKKPAKPVAKLGAKPVAKAVPKQTNKPNKSNQAVQREETASELRRKRFATNSTPLYVDSISLEPVVGRSTALEKSYLRLTGAPNPEVVRPKPVLKKALAHVIEQYTTKKRSYQWVADQIRAIRQDMTVQRIQDAFAIKVYEKNVRIALENKDMGEYNQCLTRLKELYQSDLEFVSEETGEFTAYRIFYLLYTNKLEDIGGIIKSCHGTQDVEVIHAIKVVNALVSGNRAKLFALYHEAPKLGKAALDQIIERERIAGLAAITRATKGVIDVQLVKSSLGFESNETARAFLSRYMTVGDDTSEFECEQLRSALEEAKKVIYQVDIKGQI